MPRDRARRDAFRRLIATYVFLVAALIVESLVFEVIARHKGIPSFISLDTFFAILDSSAVYGIMAVGMTFVILTGGIDLAVGSFVALGGVVCAKIVAAGVGAPDAAVWPWLLLGWFAALAIGFGGGSIAGVTITRFDIPPFIATLALMSSVRGLAFILVDGQPVGNLPPAYAALGRSRILDFGPGGAFQGVPVDAIVMVAVFLAGAWLLNETRFGRHVRAIGGNEETARLSGISVRRVKWLVYSMSATLAAAGGLISSSELGSGDPKSGFGDELEVIAAVVVGGTSLSGGRGTLLGTFLGLLIIRSLRTGLNWINTESFTQQLILGVVILAAVLLDKFKRVQVKG